MKPALAILPLLILCACARPTGEHILLRTCRGSVVSAWQANQIRIRYNHYRIKGASDSLAFEQVRQEMAGILLDIARRDTCAQVIRTIRRSRGGNWFDPNMQTFGMYGSELRRMKKE